MESFSLLKFWRLPAPAFLLSDRSPDVSDAEDDDDGSFFDLEFDVSEDDNAVASSASEGNGEGEDWNCDVDSGCPDDSSDCTSDDDLIFFKGDPLPISPSIDHATTPKTAHFPLSLLKSSARLRILISSLKKAGTSQEDPGKGKLGSDPRQKCPRLFFKFRVEAKLARDNISGPMTRVKAGLRVVCRQLGKSRSGSSAAAKVPRAFEATSRRDDSLLLHQDGIQSAILHCKRSFDESGDLDSTGLRRSAIDPSDKKLMESSAKESEIAIS